MVTVLMSTYNGEQYLRMQIDSILDQTYNDIRLIVRDDGSSDATMELLKTYSDSRLSFYKGENLGAALSFMQLIYTAPESEYYALADQDDIWLIEKISAAVEIIGQYDANIPVLYFCNQEYIDGTGHIQGVRLDEDFQIPGIVELLLANDISGCTMVFNQALLQLIKKKRIQDDILRLRYHDVWIAALAAIYGEIVFDKQVHMQFRRHGENETDGRLTESIRKNRNIFDYIDLAINGKKQVTKYWAKEVLRLCNDKLSKGEYALINKIATYDTSVKNRVKLLLSNELYSLWNGSNVVLRVKILMNWL